jgi:hypothetical protein
MDKNKNVKIIETKDFDSIPCDMRKECPGGKGMICEIATTLNRQQRQNAENVYVKPVHCTLCEAAGGYEANQDNQGIKFARRSQIDKTNIEVREKAEKYFGEGPGTELKKMIPEWMEKPGCDCRNFAKKMNIWGIQGCKKNIEVIVQRLVREKNKRNFLAWVPDAATARVCKGLVNTAIKRAEEKEGKAKHNWFVAVTTAPRKSPTLQVCLDSLLINGWKPHIFAEPGQYNVNDEFQENMIYNKEKKGVWWNWVGSCRYALENSDADIIMTVQDDSLFHPDSKEFVEKFLWPCTSTGFVSLYTPKHYSQRQHLKSKPFRPLGLNNIRTKALWGTCAVAWPRKVLELAMEHPMIDEWKGAKLKTASAWERKKKQREAEPWRIQNSDTAIGFLCRKLDRSMWFMDPSPVQHIAKHSAINHGDNSGRRNCGRCAKYSTPLEHQVPFHFNGEEARTFSNEELIF